MAELRLSKTEKALTEDDVAQRRRLRSAKSADSLLASARTSMVGNRMSNASDGTTIINPYAGMLHVHIIFCMGFMVSLVLTYFID